jgi:predicted TIM-barrel fold metal-dependent hydrolase
MTAPNDVHCHFFSTPFFAALGGDAAIATLGWDPPGTSEALADRWIAELDRHGVRRAALIASTPGDAASVAAAVTRHPTRLVGFFMVDPTQPDAATTAAAALATGALRTMCLFPSMHGYAIGDARAQRIVELAAATPGTVVSVHCGVLSVGVRRKLGLPSPFDLSRGDPVALQTVATRHASVPIIVPHFGAGFLREALMLADMCPNVHFDTSSSNGWLKYHPGLTLTAVFRQALAVVGPDRLLFGTDSSFFPRGWVRGVYEQQSSALDELGVASDVKEKIFAGNFERLFPS